MAERKKSSVNRRDVLKNAATGAAVLAAAPAVPATQPARSLGP